LLKENQDKLSWYLLSENPNAIELLKENKDKINWYYLSSNLNEIELLKKKIQIESIGIGYLEIQMQWNY
jgi:hypothetical protein